MVKTNERIDEANKLCVEKIMESHPFLVDIDHAINVIPKMEKKMVLHSGPDLQGGWDEMIGPMKGAVIGALIYEGWANSEKEVLELIRKGEVKFSSTANHNAVAPMAGIVTPSMPVYVVKNKKYGNFSFSNVNEGLGKVLRFGANDKQVIERLHWIEDVLMPALKLVLKEGEIDLKELIEASLHRGDECHNRNKTVSLLFLSSIASKLVRSDLDKKVAADIIDFINGNPHFFLNLSMASSKASLDAANNIEYSTVVNGLCTNGFNFGMRVSGIGDRWITAPSVYAKGKYFKGFNESHAAPVLGDSYYSEPAGLGGFAMAAAPAIVSFIGGEPDLGIKTTTEMYNITVTEHKYYKVANLGYRGTPLGIDIRKVLKTGILPVINTGMAHKEPGIGQVGAGIIRVPMELFKKAQKEFEDKYKIKSL